MALSASASFIAAESADVNQPRAKIQLVLGNFASSLAYGATASSNGDDASGNYPASGAIDGDRTEINIGAASSADNGVGLSSWRSSIIPGAGSPASLTITFSVSRTFNRIKLYQLSSHGLSSYQLSYWNASQSVWQVFAATSDLLPGGTSGYGVGGYGLGVYGTGTSVTSITASNTLDTVDFTSVTSTKIKLDVFSTVVAMDPANVVELEVYYLVDITDRVVSYDLKRERDYKLDRNIASTLTIECDNNDQFFSYLYTPTAAQITSGFVNSYLRPGMSVILQEGFTYSGAAPELLNKFYGNCDTITVQSKARTATLEFRDGMKGTINQLVSTKLKTSQDIATNVQYLLNIGNISNYEMSVDTTTITLDYFFVFQTTILTAIQNLIQACGDAAFYFDESGFAQFKMYLNEVPFSHTDNTTAQFNAGTLVNIDTSYTGNEFYLLRPWYLIDDFAAGNLNNWTIEMNTGSHVSYSAATNAMVVTVDDSASATEANIDTPLASDVYGTWRWRSATNFPTVGFTVDPEFIVMFINKTTTPSTFTGYGIGFKASAGGAGDSRVFVNLYKFVAGVKTTLAAMGQIGTLTTPDTTMHEWRIIRDTSGNFSYSLDLGPATYLATDTTVTSGQSKVSVYEKSTAISAGASPKFTIDDIYYNAGIDGFYLLDTVTTSTASFISAAIDQSASVNLEGNLNASAVINATDNISWFTRTSADNITYDADVAITLGNHIGSTARRYIKYKVTYSPTVLDTLHNTPVVISVTSDWFQGTGSQKYPATASFNETYSGNILDIEQEISDNLGGDTSITNDVQVNAAPLTLTGTNADTQWQGTAGTPAAAVSGSNPYSVSVGTYTFLCVVSSGMDTSLMSGANPAAAVVTFASSATGSWVISTINPTQPVLTITITHSGTITDLRLIGKKFSSSNTPYQATAKDTTSISLYGDRLQNISNNYIISQSIAQTIATRIVANFKSPTDYIKTMPLRPTFRMQLGDRVNVVDSNTAISSDYIIAQLNDKYEVKEKSASVQTIATLIRITQ